MPYVYPSEWGWSAGLLMGLLLLMGGKRFSLFCLRLPAAQPPCRPGAGESGGRADVRWLALTEPSSDCGLLAAAVGADSSLQVGSNCFFCVAVLIPFASRLHPCLCPPCYCHANPLLLQANVSPYSVRSFEHARHEHELQVGGALWGAVPMGAGALFARGPARCGCLRQCADVPAAASFLACCWLPQSQTLVPLLSAVRAALWVLLGASGSPSHGRGRRRQLEPHR